MLFSARFRSLSCRSDARPSTRVRALNDRFNSVRFGSSVPSDTYAGDSTPPPLVGHLCHLLERLLECGRHFLLRLVAQIAHLGGLKLGGLGTLRGPKSAVVRGVLRFREARH